MADPSPYSEPNIESGMPRWVKVFGIIFIIVAVLFGILHLAGGGFGSHMHSREQRVQQQ